MRRPPTAALAFLVLAACNGRIADPFGGSDDGAEDALDRSELPATCAGATPELGPSPLVRLSATEYRNTVRDLLGVEADVTLPADDLEGIFRSNASAPTSRLHVEAYAEAAAAVAQSIPAGELGACSGAAPDAECARAFVERFGRRAYRRPLSEEEVGAALALYDAVAGDAAPDEVERLLVEAFLQAPQFLYRVETVASSGARALDGWEIASRLSYLLWNTMPDDALFDAAESGELEDPDALESHARRMLASPRADAMIGEMHDQWLGIVPDDPVAKDAELFPEFDAPLHDAMIRETELLVATWMRHGDRRIDTLFSTDRTIVSAELAALYGAERDDGWLPAEAVASLPDGFFPARLPAGERAGVLTHASILAALAKPNQTAPVLRGAFVLERVLCTELGQPPPSVMADPPEPDPTISAREQYRQHSDDPGCRGCHELIDPVGFAFEGYDSMGRFRTTDPGGHPIDATGEVAIVETHGSEPTRAPVDGAVDLAHAIAGSADLSDCVTRQWFRYALSRHEEERGEACLIDDLRARFDASGGDVAELVVAIVTSPAFRHAASN